MPIDPKKLQPGALVKHVSGGAPLILDRRKEDDSGWWLRDGGGLADHVWNHGTWTIVGNDYLQMAYNALCSAEASLDKANAGLTIRGRLAALRAELAETAFIPDETTEG